MSRYIRNRIGSILVVMTVAAAACSGETSTNTAATGAADAGSGATPSAPAVKLTGKVITVEMYTDAEGNYFKPKDLEVHRGDVVRFVLRSGVHNVNFLPDSNPGKTGLPRASDFLQLPGQEHDVIIDFAPGHYYFQCDPHALLGMVGRLEVEDDDN